MIQGSNEDVFGESDGSGYTVAVFVNEEAMNPACNKDSQ